MHHMLGHFIQFIFIGIVLKYYANLKDYCYHAFSNTEFSYFLTIDTRQYELSNYLLKIGGHRPLKGCNDVICNDLIFHLMVNNSKT